MGGNLDMLAPWIIMHAHLHVSFWRPYGARVVGVVYLQHVDLRLRVGLLSLGNDQLQHSDQDDV